MNSKLTGWLTYSFVTLPSQKKSDQITDIQRRSLLLLGWKPEISKESQRGLNILQKRLTQGWLSPLNYPSITDVLLKSNEILNLMERDIHPEYLWLPRSINSKK